MLHPVTPRLLQEQVMGNVNPFLKSLVINDVLLRSVHQEKEGRGPAATANNNLHIAYVEIGNGVLLNRSALIIGPIDISTLEYVSFFF